MDALQLIFHFFVVFVLLVILYCVCFWFDVDFKLIAGMTLLAILIFRGNQDEED